MPRPPMTRAIITCGNIYRQARPDCADKVKDADPQQCGFAPEAVSRPAADERTDDGAVEGGSHGNPVESGTEPPKRLNGFFRAGDDDRVKAEEEPGERGSERPEEDASIHRWKESISASHDKRIIDTTQMSSLQWANPCSGPLLFYY